MKTTYYNCHTLITLPTFPPWFLEFFSLDFFQMILAKEVIYFPPSDKDNTLNQKQYLIHVLVKQRQCNWVKYYDLVTLLSFCQFAKRYQIKCFKVCFSFGKGVILHTASLNTSLCFCLQLHIVKGAFQKKASPPYVLPLAI